VSRRQVLALAALAALAALVVWIALRSRQPPMLPADDAHAAFVGAEACLACHGPGSPLPRGPNHPHGNDCTRCHGFR
jgi:hypothetical protein